MAEGAFRRLADQNGKLVQPYLYDAHGGADLRQGDNPSPSCDGNGDGRCNLDDYGLSGHCFCPKPRARDTRYGIARNAGPLGWGTIP